MNINMRQANERRFVEHIDTVLNTTRTIWEIITLKTLHEEFGFGEKRLEQFAEAMQINYNGLSREMCLTDTYKKGSTATNLDTAMIRTVRDLREDGIDYRKILGDKNMLIFIEKDGKKVDIDEYVDKILENKKMGWERK